MCSCPFSWIISLARSSRLSANFLCALAATADFSSEHWMFLVSPFGQKEQWLTDLCCPLTDMISRWNHQLQLSKVHQNAILLAVSCETLDDKDAGCPICLQMDKLSATSHWRWTNQIYRYIYKLNAETILGLHNSSSIIRNVFLKYLILWHNCYTIDIDDYVQIPSWKIISIVLLNKALNLMLLQGEWPPVRASVK